MTQEASNWYVVENGKPQGPLGVDVLMQKIKQGEVGRESLVWREGLESWKAIAEVDEFASAYRATPPPVSEFPLHAEAIPTGTIPPPPPPSADTPLLSIHRTLSGRPKTFSVLNWIVYIVLAWAIVGANSGIAQTAEIVGPGLVANTWFVPYILAIIYGVMLSFDRKDALPFGIILSLWVPVSFVLVMSSAGANPLGYSGEWTASGPLFVFGFPLGLLFYALHMHRKVKALAG